MFDVTCKSFANFDPAQVEPRDVLGFLAQVAEKRTARGPRAPKRTAKFTPAIFYAIRDRPAPP